MTAAANTRCSDEADPSNGDARRATVEVTRLVAGLADLDRSQLLLQWRNHLGGAVLGHLPTWLLARLLAYRLQATAFGDIAAGTLAALRRLAGEDDATVLGPFARRAGATRAGEDLRPGALLAREWRGRLERVTVLEDGYAWNGRRFGSLSKVARAITGTSWNGHRFFGLKSGRGRQKAASP